jgi:2-polyprenyl-6-hydroxyphenyl methylase/3-demethylubiquinone-9 3-methyltransferase
MSQQLTAEPIRFGWTNPERTQCHDFLIPAVDRALAPLRARLPAARIFDIGCGNGIVAAHLQRQGFHVQGIDPAEDGIAQARLAHPDLDLRPGSAYDDLAAGFGTFDAVVSLEVVEHLYFPHRFAQRAFELLKPDGLLLLSTPYHGWLKNVLIATTGKWDYHHHPLRDHGHIKFWSEPTLRSLLEGAGFHSIRFARLGRFPAVAKSVFVTARR